MGLIKPPQGSLLTNLPMDIRKSCRGWWEFNEGIGSDTVHDISGYGNHGTLTSMDPDNDWEPGPNGYILDFDGSDDYVTAGDSSDLDLDNGFTILTSFLGLDDSRSPDEVIVSKYSDDTGGEWFYKFDVGSTNKQQFACWDGGSLTANVYGSNTTWNPGTYYTTSVTWDGATYRFFIGGLSDGSTADSNGPGSGNLNNLEIGRAGDGTQYFEGGIDRVIIFNEALTAEQIKWLYDNL